MKPEDRARQQIDSLLQQAGWQVCDLKDANIHVETGTVKGVAIREFPLNPGFGFADYLLYVNGKACGVIEAKKEGATLTGVELQSGRYAQGLPNSLPAWRRPLPFVWESTGVETHFTNGLDPEPRARSVAATTGDKAQHIRNRGFDNRYYRDLIVDLVRAHQPVSREDIDKLLLTKLPDVLTADQKTNRVHNLLVSLSGKRILNAGTRQDSRWVLIDSLISDPVIKGGD